ncbi:MAG: hypothetical protein ACQESP_08765, partial [Candidatus Muiribacteriota bacterium]
MKNDSILKFIDYKVKDFKFEQDVMFNFSEKPELLFDIDNEVYHKDDGYTFIEMSFKVFDENFIENKQPMYLYASVLGVFKVDGDKNAIPEIQKKYEN